MFSKDFNKYFLSLFFVATFSLVSVAQDSEEVVASEEVSESSDEDVEDVGRVTVTGSRIKRTDIEGASPLLVITRDDIDNAGFNTVFDAVSSLSQNTGETVGEQFQAGFNPNINAINLRDFGPGRTLVLVNGKRMADYPYPYNGESSSFNYASIPLAVVDRIEVLAAGASSIYGSDAIAGVINVITIDGLEDMSLRVFTGTHLSGGGDNTTVEFAGGGFTDKLSYTYAFEFYKQDPIFGDDRKEFDSYKDRKNPLYRFPTRGFLMRSYFGSRQWTPEQARAGTYTCQDADPAYTTEDPYPQYYGGRGGYCGLDDGYATLVNERERSSAYFSATYELTDNISLYAKGIFFDMDAFGSYTNQFFYSYVSGYFDPQYFTPSTGYYGPNYGLGNWQAEDFLWQKIWSDSLWSSTYSEEAETYVLGLQGVMSNGWAWDVSYTENTYDMVSNGTNFAYSLLEPAVFNIGGVDQIGNPCTMDQSDNFGLYDPFGMYPYGYYYGQPSCTNMAWLFSSQTDADIQSLKLPNVEPASSYSDFFVAEISGELFDMPYGPALFAAHYEYQDVGYNVSLDQKNKDGLLWGSGGVDGGGQRDRTAFGIEITFPLTQTLLVDISARNDEYDDKVVNIDRTTLGASFEYRPTDNFLLRGTWNESFRAPDMPYIFVGERRSYAQPTDYYQCWASGVYPGNCSSYSSINVDQVLQGNKGLKEEEGDSYSLGFVWQPADRLVLTFDMFHIQLEDIVNDLATNAIMLDELSCRAAAAGQPLDNLVQYSNSYCQQILSSVVRGGRPTEPDESLQVPEGGVSTIYNQPINMSGQEFIGADYSIAYSWVTDNYGDFSLRLNGTYQHDLKFASRKGDPLISYMDSAYVLRSRQTLYFNWSYGDWYVGGSTYRIGHAEGYDGKKSPYLETSLVVGYELTDKSSISVSVQNLFNSYPDKDASYNSGSSYYPFGVNQFIYPLLGRQLYVTYQVRF